MSTFCPQLWDGCYIDRRGEVFACCHLSPESYGNIHNLPLSELVNSARAVSSRSASLSGRLICYQSCNLFAKASSQPLGAEQSVISYSELRRLHISMGEACNVRCVMCNHPQRHSKSPILLEPEVVIRNVDFSPFSTVIIQGGEPLILRQCLDLMSHLESIGKKYTILTNGTVIDDRMAIRLATHAHRVNVSINGATKEAHEAVNRGSRFERVLENVHRVRKAREALGTGVVLTGHMTITTSNVHEIPLFIQTFPALGFDRVNFGYVKETVPSYLTANPSVFDRLRQQTGDALAGVGTRNVDTLRLRMLGLAGPLEQASAFAPNT